MKEKDLKIVLKQHKMWLDSEGKEGTTFTSSNWVEECVNNYSEHPLYGDMKFYCFGLAPHSTADMKAVWMEEQGNRHTQT